MSPNLINTWHLEHKIERTGWDFGSMMNDASENNIVVEVFWLQRANLEISRHVARGWEIMFFQESYWSFRCLFVPMTTPMSFCHRMHTIASCTECKLTFSGLSERSDDLNCWHWALVRNSSHEANVVHFMVSNKFPLNLVGTRNCEGDVAMRKQFLILREI